MLINFIQYIGGAFLGWGLGANDSANVFGTAVSSRMVSYKLAIILTAIFVVIGAVMQGEAGIETLSKKLRNIDYVASTTNLHSIPLSHEQIAKQNIIASARAKQVAMVVSFSAALTVVIMTLLKIPVSTSQAVVGSIIGVGLIQDNVNVSGLGKVIACWFGTPIGAALFTIVFYYFFRAILKKWNPSVFVYDPVITFLLIICGCYGAYALGANNVANVSAIFVGEEDGMLTTKQAAWFGSLVIAFGAISYSKPVMMTVGKGIVKLDSFTAFICVLAHAVTVHLYAIIGVPVSTSQAIVGAILGIGLIKGVHVINYRMLRNVTLGWMATPFFAAFFAALGYFMVNLHYQPI